MLAVSTPMLVVSFVPAATSSLIRDVQEVTSANVFHCFRIHCIASSAGCPSKTTTRQKRPVWGAPDENGHAYRTALRATLTATNYVLCQAVDIMLIANYRN